MWESAVDGRRLRFRLAGINNQNFIMRDEQTGSWWQQVTGRAIAGPLKGKQLTLVPHDEVAFGTWKADHPSGRVLKPDADRRSARRLRITRLGAAHGEDARRHHTADSDRRSPPRTLVVGVTVHGRSKAYPLDALRDARACCSTWSVTCR